ncbi:sensor domain-containing diguanylate cyclase [Clostridium aminobutyricum]|uniref:Diguanylate cyclase n=1 Tax=Clostridium aminobutyricum TaxID=33953 RepID=A0A939D5Z7_CLOAM|nr:diguanylate cyclase [Clostridium aminobutyricum]MBN7771782.1 diguanylate cyclase [Clostridium aminobutyricum]
MRISKEYIRYKYMIENIKDIIWEMNANFIFTFVSMAAKETSGYEAKELIGRCMLDFLTPESKQHVMERWKQRVGNKDSLKKVILYDVEFICKDGKIIWVEVSVKPITDNSELIGYIGVTRDISEKKAYENELKRYIEELKSANQRLDELATFDLLTGAYNRRKFEHFVNLFIEDNAKHDTPFSIIMFDIDFFKRINDTYGHKTGDRILREITAVAKRAVREGDKIFRWGGEEFIILLPGESIKGAYEIAEKVRMAIEMNDFAIENDRITVSLGVGEYDMLDNIDQFVSRIDNALLKAKSNGKNRVEVIELRADEELQIQNYLG